MSATPEFPASEITAQPAATTAGTGAGTVLEQASRRFDQLRHRARRGIFTEALAAGLVALVIYAVITFVIDRNLRLETPFRLVLLGGFAFFGEFPQLSPDYNMTSHKVVLITDKALNPRLATLDKGQLVAWISYSGQPSTVVFEREVARSMICHSLVNFSIKEDELRSAPFTPVNSRASAS